jgi:hypothetical protein
MESAAERCTGIEAISVQRKRAGAASRIALHFKKGDLHTFAGKQGAGGKTAYACADNDAMNVLNIHILASPIGFGRVRISFSQPDETQDNSPFRT